jgi:hypothetical protein
MAGPMPAPILVAVAAISAKLMTLANSPVFIAFPSSLP